MQETIASLIVARATEGGRTLRRAALDFGLPVSLFYAWATAGTLPSPLSIPRLAAALGMPEAELAARVAAERAARPIAPPTPRQRRQPAPGDASAVAADVDAAVAADAALVRSYVAALSDGKVSRPELVELRARAEAVRQRAADLVRDLDAAIEASPAEVSS